MSRGRRRSRRARWAWQFLEPELSALEAQATAVLMPGAQHDAARGGPVELELVHGRPVGVTVDQQVHVAGAHCGLHCTRINIHDLTRAHVRMAPAASARPLCQALTHPQRQAQELVLSDVLRRVGGLESFAGLVDAADKATRKESIVRELHALDDTHADLLAGIGDTAMDADLAHRLADDATAVIEQARQAIKEANDAALSLALPGDEPGDEPAREVADDA